MYFIYVDESGDPGLSGGGTDFFYISGLIVHETHWNTVFQRFLDLRRGLSSRYGIPQRTALHATEIVNGHGDFHHSQYGLTPPQRFDLYREVMEFLAQLPEVRVLNVCVRKDRINIPLGPNFDLFDFTWRMFIQRFHTFVDRGGHLNRDNEYGLIFSDRTHNEQLRRLLRQMRAFNLVPSQIPGSPARPILVTRILDDPIPRESNHSYFVQMADMIAFALARRDYPRTNLQRFQFETYFDIIDPILLKVASRNQPQGIVYWP